MRPVGDNDIESELSYAYLHAVASKAKMSCSFGNRHDDNNGVDAKLSAIGPFDGGGYLNDISMNIQLKATKSTPTFVGDYISYLIQGIKRYDELRLTNLFTPRFLVVLFLDEVSDNWLQITADQLIIKKCAYWVSLRGAPDSTNGTGQTIYIPKENLLTPSALHTIASTLSRKEKIDYRLP